MKTKVIMSTNNKADLAIFLLGKLDKTEQKKSEN